MQAPNTQRVIVGMSGGVDSSVSAALLLRQGWQVEGLLGESRQSLIYRVHNADDQPWLLKTLPASRASEEQAGPALLQEEWFLRRVAGR